MNDLATIITKNILANGECSRLFHGRGRQFPGLEHIVVDFFPPTILITLYKETTDEVLSGLLDNLKAVSAVNVLIQKRYLPRPTIEALVGEIPSTAIAKERNSFFNLKFGDTQNIGFFLDMYPGREMLEKISKDKKVLNLFSYTCSLSVAALMGGASEVTNMDTSKPALSLGESNHSLNKLDPRKAKYVSHDIMKSWNNIYKRGPFDVIVIDPPTNQGESFKVDRDYFKIVKRLNEMSAASSVVLACLNSPYLTSQFIKDLFVELAPDFEFQEVVYSAFAAMEVNPEEGLKIVVFKKKS